MGKHHDAAEGHACRGEVWERKVRAEKNKQHGRSYRVVPLPAVLEMHLVEWMEQAPEGEPLLFPGMKKDLLPVVKDITTYEQITDNSYTIVAKHYQTMTDGRLATGMNQALEALDNFSSDTKNAPESVQFLSKKASES